MKKKRVLLLSESKIKLEALKRVLPEDEYLIETQAVSVPDNPEQPIEPFGIVCAKLRIQHAPIPPFPAYEYVYSIENSIDENVSEAFAADVVHVIRINTANNRCKCATGNPLYFPRDIVVQAKKESEHVSLLGFSKTAGKLLNPENPKDWSNRRIAQIEEALNKLQDDTVFVTTARDLAASINYIPHFPKPNVLFKDISPLFENRATLEIFTWFLEACMTVIGKNVTHVVGIESRGFALGAIIANLIGCGFVMVRKKGKLPPPIHSIEYGTEYSKDTLEIPQTIDWNTKEPRIMIVDDLVATGGSFKAVVDLVTRHFSSVTIDCCFALTDVHHLRKKAQKTLGRVHLYTLF